MEKQKNLDRKFPTPSSYLLNVKSFKNKRRECMCVYIIQFNNSAVTTN